MARDPEKLPAVGTVLGSCLEALRIASVLLAPFLPDRCAELWRRIGEGDGTFEERVRWGRLVPGTAIESGKPLFPRYQTR
jgi:methionyl-tRNA synthetase